VFSADGRTLYTSSLDGTVIKWDLGSQRRFGRPFTTGARAPTQTLDIPLAPPLAISPDGTQFAARTAANTVGIFSLATLQRQTSLTIPRAVRQLLCEQRPSVTEQHADAPDRLRPVSGR
jgi:WD40 repeat protein